MPKTITLRLEDEIYKKFSEAASEEHRSMSNLIETLALKNWMKICLLMTLK